MCVSWFRGQFCFSTLGQRPWARTEIGAFTVLFQINQGDVGQFPKFKHSFRWANTSTGFYAKNEKRVLSACKQSALFSAPLPQPLPPTVITQQITSFFKSSKPRDLSATGPQQVCVLQRWWRLYLHGIRFESRCLLLSALTCRRQRVWHRENREICFLGAGTPAPTVVLGT